jgi:predicted ribosome quality control (RQC) complex YloA/Tae2 family protein
VSRLRKFLRSRRVTSISQIGTDRIIDIAFSDGLYHLFLEFFAGGNIILTDGEHKILALWRQVAAGGDQEEVKVGLNYTVTNKQNYHGVPQLSLERLKDTLQKAVEAETAETAPKKAKKKQVDSLRKALSRGFPEYPPLLLEHAIAVADFDTGIRLEQVLQDDGLLTQVMGVLEEADRVTRQLSVSDKHSGYIVAKEDTRSAESESKEKRLLYEDFHPFKPRQVEGKPGFSILEFDGFNKTVDEYFSSIESQKLESRLTEHEEAARRKLESARSEHQKRVGALKEAQEIHVRKAEAIHANVYRVQEAMDAVNGLIAQGMDWVDIARLIEMEQGRNNPVATIIKLPLKLYENRITLMLGEASHEVEEYEDEAYGSRSEDEDSEEDSDVEEKKEAQRVSRTLTIDIDLGLSPWANATQYYEQKKVAAVKEQRTLQSSGKALKSQEKKVTEDLKRNLKQEKQVLRPSRQPFWFEKYLFFVSSDGYLVLG